VKAWRALALAILIVLALVSLRVGPARADTPTPTPTPTLTPTPPWELLVVLPVSGKAMLIERRWSYGEEAIFFAVVGLGALLAVGWVYDLVRGETARPEDGADVL